MTETILALCLLASLGVIFYLSHRLATTNRQAFQWADTCMKQTLAFNEDQRMHMRDKMELERAPVAPPRRESPDPDRRPKPYQPEHPADIFEQIQNGTADVVPYGT